MAQQTESELYYDPWDYDIDVNVHAVWKRLRDEAPVYYNDTHDFYALSRFEDVWNASRDTTSFVNGRGTVLDTLQHPLDPWEELLLLYMDPPRHTTMRALVSRAFTPRRISDLEDDIRSIAAGYLDPFVGTSGFDYVEQFGALLPPMVIGALLGIPPEDRDQIRRWFDELMHRDPGSIMPSEIAHAAIANVLAYIHAMVAERRRAPTDDFITALVQAEIEEDGAIRRLTDEELVSFVMMLTGAGVETVARFLSWTAVVFARHPDQRALLVDDPSIIPNAVEEQLRFETPSPINCRWVAKPVTYHGVEIPAGSKLAILNGAGNLDEREFDDPERFDVRRKIVRHASFGYGAHFCLGASLARMECQIAVAETLKRFPTWDIDESELDWVHTSTVRGFHHAPIHLP